MAIDYPASPTVGNIFTAANSAWQWDGVKWAPAASGTNYVTMGGEVTGLSNATIVSMLQGQPLGKSTAQLPTAASPWGLMAWNTTVDQWEYETGMFPYNTVSSAGSSQTTAAATPAFPTGAVGFLEITGGIAAGGILWTPLSGAELLVHNSIANTVLIYPPVGGTINALAVNASIALMPDTTAFLLGFSSSRIITVP